MIRFYKEFGEYGYLANYSNHGFYKNGVYYKTVEHYYQSEKFDDEIIKKRIIDAETPKEASNIGRDRNNIRKDNFKIIKNQVMLEGILEKFRQNKDILYKLIETRDKYIEEETIDEYYWGVGKDHTGLNTIGKLLMEARSILKKEILDTIINNCGDEVYVIGHNNPDADSIFSSLLITNILKSIGIKAHFSVLDSYIYSSNDSKLINDHLNIKPEVVADITNKKFLLVDHNTLDGIPSNQVVGSIDHHMISNQVDNILEMEYASTGLLIYDLFKDKYEFSREEKLLIGLTVLADTEYLCSSRFSDSDKILYDSLNLDINVKEYQAKYFVTTNFNNTIDDNINNNLKRYNYNDTNINRVLISSYKLDFDLYLDKYIKYMDSLEGNWLLIWANYEDKVTTIYYKGDIYNLDYLTTSTYITLKMLEEKKIIK